MIRRNQQNRKAYIDLQCPGCGMSLDDRRVEGFATDNQTYCCAGCAQGTGCTCQSIRLRPKKAGQKPGHMGQRNPENSLHDRNFNQEINTSGRVIGHKRETEDAPARFHSRAAYTTEPPKQKKSLTKPKDSTKEQARGRSEFVKRSNHEARVDRVAMTGTKSGRSNRKQFAG
jgi:hypothetical protein